MNQDFNSNANTNQNTNSSRDMHSENNYWAADDVHRLALRRPALYQTKQVPQVPNGGTLFSSAEQGSMA